MDEGPIAPAAGRAYRACVMRDVSVGGFVILAWPAPEADTG